jgi:hypothetical protein
MPAAFWKNMRKHKIVAIGLVCVQTALLIWFGEDIRKMVGYKLWQYLQNTSILGLVLILFARVIHQFESLKRKERAEPAQIFTFLGWVIIVATGAATVWMLRAI